MTEEIRDILDHKIEKISKYQNGDKFVVEIMESGYPYSVIGERRNCSEEFLDSLDRLDGDYINEHFGELQDEAYNKGLNDAWKALNKIHCEISCGELDNMFGYSETACILEQFTPQEALAKLKAYEGEQGIKVGDVVIYGDSEVLVTNIHKQHFDGVQLSDDNEQGDFGDSYTDRSLNRCKKTGKHLDISSILEQIGE